MCLVLVILLLLVLVADSFHLMAWQKRGTVRTGRIGRGPICRMSTPEDDGESNPALEDLKARMAADPNFDPMSGEW